MMSLVLSVSMMMAVTASAQTMTGRTRPGTTSANTSAAVSSQRNTGNTSRVTSAASSGTTRTTVSSTNSSGKSSTTVATRTSGTGKVSSSSTSAVSTTRPSISASKASQGSSTTSSVTTRSGNNTGKSSTTVGSTTGSVRNSRSGGSGTTTVSSNNSGKGGSKDNGKNGGKDNGKGKGNDRPSVGGKGSGYGPGNAHNYNGHPNANHFNWNYSHRDWSRPIAPPARDFRPVFRTWRRPAIPSGYIYYSNAPIIDRIFGITFGSRMSISLDFLYGNGYFIDGYTDKVVYLRDIEMYNLLWDDAMLSYDGGLLKGVQLSSSTSVIDRTRFNLVYHRLTALYGSPVRVSESELTWFGSRGAGYITLSAEYSAGRYYTTLWISN